MSEETPGATVLTSEGSGRGATIATGIRGHTEDSPERPEMLSGEREVCESQVQGKEGEGRTKTPWRGDGAECHPTLGLGLSLAPPHPTSELLGSGPHRPPVTPGALILGVEDQVPVLMVGGRALPNTCRS